MYEYLVRPTGWWVLASRNIGLSMSNVYDRTIQRANPIWLGARASSPLELSSTNSGARSNEAACNHDLCLASGESGCCPTERDSENRRYPTVLGPAGAADFGR